LIFIVIGTTNQNAIITLATAVAIALAMAATLLFTIATQRQQGKKRILTI
jgi:hypothetical protein